jgi:hypothetical protein
MVFAGCNDLGRVTLPELISFQAAITPKEVSSSINIKSTFAIYSMLNMTKFSYPNYLRRIVINKSQDGVHNEKE